jgi:hypothetical protein
MRTIILAAIMAAAVPAVANAEIAQPKKLLAMSPAAFAEATTLQNDRLESHATLSTEKAHRESWRVLDPYGQDNHLRAIVDKKTGATRYEVRQTLRYWGVPRDYTAAHYRGPAGMLRKVALSEARPGEDFCPLMEIMQQCPQTHVTAFEIDEATMRHIAAGYQPGARDSWGFKLKDAMGYDITSGIVPAEAAGLLQAVDQFRGRSGAS